MGSKQRDRDELVFKEAQKIQNENVVALESEWKGNDAEIEEERCRSRAPAAEFEREIKRREAQNLGQIRQTSRGDAACRLSR